MAPRSHWLIAADTGGTFTDCIARDPGGTLHRMKVLSSGKIPVAARQVDQHTWNVRAEFDCKQSLIDGVSILHVASGRQSTVASFDPVRHVLVTCDAIGDGNADGDAILELHPKLPSSVLAAHLVTRTPFNAALPACDLRLATTRGTNALLEGTTTAPVLFVTAGFADVLQIGDQRRPDLFALDIIKRSTMTNQVVEVAERCDANGQVVQQMDEGRLRAEAARCVERGATIAAVSLLNSVRNTSHEMRSVSILEEAGFQTVCCSSSLSALLGYLPRTETTVINAALSPVIESYLSEITAAVPHASIRVMSSAGGLHDVQSFEPRDSLLSGPAGGVAGAAAIGRAHGFQRLLAFDMGGTSTDISRYDHGHHYVDVQVIGDTHLRNQALEIETIAAGGGSICDVVEGRLAVGPQSSGADPGPACYGRGGPLTLTDVNLLMGRIDEASFGIPISKSAARSALLDVCNRLGTEGSNEEQVLVSLLEIANAKMVSGIQKVSIQRGVNPADYTLVAFGGAGGQHACALAQALEIKTILVPADASILSASGLLQTPLTRLKQRQFLQPLEDVVQDLPQIYDVIISEAMRELEMELSEAAHRFNVRRMISVRLQGQQAAIEFEVHDNTDIGDAFSQAYEVQYGYEPEGVVEVDTVRVLVAALEDEDVVGNHKPRSADLDGPETVSMCIDGCWRDVPCHDVASIDQGVAVQGPALLRMRSSSVVVESDWVAFVDCDGSVRMELSPSTLRRSTAEVAPKRIEAASRSLQMHCLTTIAEEMGARLVRTAMSPNIKERLDFSCAILDRDGKLVVNGAHIPVHLGAIGPCVRAVCAQHRMQPGDVWVTNHPAWGGSHLPDITVIAPVFVDTTLIGFVANRAHHAELGGRQPGSMPPDATRLVEEGVVLSPMRVVTESGADFHVVEQRLRNGPFPSRSPLQNVADLRAQVAGNLAGVRALQKAAAVHGVDFIRRVGCDLAVQTRRALSEKLAALGSISRNASVHCDDGSTINVQLDVCLDDVNDPVVRLDFHGTSGVHPGNLNAPSSIVNAAILYVMRLLVGSRLPLNESLMDHVQVVLPPCMINPPMDGADEELPAVVGGNVETSQHLANLLLEVFDLAAHGQGTMNNILFGNDSFGFYETICGGVGATRHRPGAHAVHSHMTNTAITDPEILEHAFPVRLRSFSVRRGSGGAGALAGGDGVERVIEFLEPVSLSVLTQHRVNGPLGAHGGKQGCAGQQFISRVDGRVHPLASIDGVEVNRGDVLTVRTPGGGGWGSSD